MKTLLIIAVLFLLACAPPTQEQTWVRTQDHKCVAAYSRGTYNAETKIYECWNKPAFRRPKLVFSEKYV